jgi:hypothetical protein
MRYDDHFVSVAEQKLFICESVRSKELCKDIVTLRLPDGEDVVLHRSFLARFCFCKQLRIARLSPNLYPHLALRVNRRLRFPLDSQGIQTHRTIVSEPADIALSFGAASFPFIFSIFPAYSGTIKPRLVSTLATSHRVTRVWALLYIPTVQSHCFPLLRPGFVLHPYTFTCVFTPLFPFLKMTGVTSAVLGFPRIGMYWF